MRSRDLFVARCLTSDDGDRGQEIARRAFALVSLAHPSLSFAAWTRYLRRATSSKDGRSGLVLIEDPRGYPHALYRYEVDVQPSLVAASEGLARVLNVRDLVIADVVGAGPDLLTAIARHGEELGRELRCDAVAVHLPQSVVNAVEGLEGYRAVSDGIMVRRITTASPSGGPSVTAVSEQSGDNRSPSRA
ncbi:hypothetical protein [Hansschlegelia zhihuaiae]|uniref:GNAT family N-acetyltransferase n=1 Tax=Hansschlegelia zhihuaiae TaxID=405005 RepID=A0A4Q0MI97_9HYPH|nr:hypothetical protein [Hansschlegelia zhihuaiae]RXF73194.1 hypothetical protein EK403_11985 [Hansschlegelia zhihuaiae]